ncbi:MAG: AMIN domain-containing protein [Gemmatimonadetes bacterium]|nr:AMIN domain-containing protein [Gemmatimonadota bacterium]
MMRRLATALLALAALAGLAPAAAAHTPSGTRSAGPAVLSGSVSALSIVAGARKTEVIIHVDGDIDVQDFTIDATPSTPKRVVLDLRNAVLAAPPAVYDRVSRGGITNVRMAQFKENVVRIVLELDGPRNYEVAKGDNELRVLIDGSDRFASWTTAAGGPAAAEARATGRQQAAAQAAAEPVIPLALPATALRGSTAKAPAAQPRITVTYQEADIKDVISAFAAFARRTIVVGKAVTGTVTAEIVDQPWDVALQAILKAQGLDAKEEASGIITVDSYQNLLVKEASEPLGTHMVKLNYANASTIRVTLSSLLSRDCSAAGAAGGGGGGGVGGAGGQGCVVRGTVVSDSGTNSLLITDVPSRIPTLLEFVRDLDFKTPQVAIKAKIIFVNRSRIEDIGLRYDLRTANQFSGKIFAALDSTGQPVQGDRIALGGNAITGVANANANVTGPTLSLIFSTAMGSYFLTSFIDALRENQLADVQAEPSIVTLDNRAATIFSGQEIPFRVVDAGTGGGTGLVSARATVRTTEAGISLAVTPHITNNRQILLTLSAENSDAQLAASDVGFILNRQKASNQLLVSDGETAVIGGLTVTTVNVVKQGIPFLMDIPLLGRLFSRNSRRESKRDLLILVTPHILEEAERAPAPPGR